MRKTQFVDNHFYHVFNRGVDRRVIFQDTADYRRFYFSMYLFNDLNFCSPGKSIFKMLRGEDAQRHLLELAKDRVELVRIISFCLLPNHFHFLLQQVQEDGISKFMHRLGMGYANFFNKRYERSGRLFQGNFQAVLVERDAQFIHLPRYIHLNALDLTALKWRDGLVENWGTALNALDGYAWSSHRVYRGWSQYLPVVDERSTRSLFPDADGYLAFLKAWGTRACDKIASSSWWLSASS